MPDCPICGTHRTIHKLIDYERVLRHSRRRGAGKQTARPRNHAARIEAAPGSAAMNFYPGCARAARIPDLQSQGAPDPARRIAAPRARTGFFARDRGPLPQRQALRRSGGFSAQGRFPQGLTICAAAFWRGPRKWIPPCRATKASVSTVAWKIAPARSRPCTFYSGCARYLGSGHSPFSRSYKRRNLGRHKSDVFQ